ncbi:putative solute binding protein [Caldisphaera lagunensis DSM 15908]|uniref:Putative solute binding protein n=1 Tax=Caldisphaera lagunensis (strain DSM 15908 / JCM 11604 / ANMR 0165 / IC-154) TaxID=1056495 RepID=L0AA63_CALLD|nr:ABC transporter substrate-binding protein [Caldisphaera lagunensis]AFZ70793.1 putative solute binding protein [Caldisphaera lagunensis DSM 15908]
MVRKILVGILLGIMMLSFVLPYTYINGKAQTTQYPRLNTITVLTFGGNDLNGLEAFTSGSIQMYTFPIPPSKITSLPSNVSVYIMPVGIYDVLLNPVNTTWGFNPFMFQPVRYAVNYLVNRQFFVQQILGGYGMPEYGPYAGEYEALATSNATAKYVGITYNLTYANQTIYNTLIKHGAQYINGKWYYNGKPITIYFFVRTDTIIRQEYASDLINELEQLGFTVQTISGNLAKQNLLIYGSDPANSTWNIAIESWSGGYSYYEYGNPVEFYSTWYSAVPATSQLYLSFGSYNDSARETPDLLKMQTEIDNISLQLLNTNFNTSKQYYSLLNQLVSLGMNESIRVFIARSFIPIYGSPTLQGVLPSIYYGSVLNTPNYMTMYTPSGVATIGVRYLSQGAMNPGFGFTDAYSVDLAYALIYPLSEAGPNGYTVPTGVILKVVNESNTTSILVPQDALVYNTTANKLQRVEPNTYAQLAIIANFAPIIQNTKFADGQNVTLADILNIYLEAAKMVSPNNSISDSAVQGFYSSFINSISGFKIINSTAIEIWGNVRFFDPLYAAETLLGDFLPLGGYSPASLFPWQLYSAMNKLVSSGMAAWDQPTAEQKGVDWLSIVNLKDVSNILSALQNFSSTNYISPTLLEVQNLSGVTLVTPSSAQSGYQALINYINTYGNAFVSNGPFMLTSYNVNTGAILKRNPYFNMTLPSVVLATPMIYTTSINVPTILTPGQTLTGTVSQTPDNGSKVSQQPAPNVIVYAQLIDSNGNVVKVYNTTTGANGNFEITLPSNLPTGKYYLRAYAYTYQNIFMFPVVYSLFVVPSTTTTSTTTSTTSTTTPSTTTTSTTTSTTSTTTPSTTTTSTTTPSTTTTSTTTSTTSTTTIIAVAVVIVIIVIVAAVLLVRRR